jgi:hypothetical protein
MALQGAKSLLVWTEIGASAQRRHLPTSKTFAAVAADAGAAALLERDDH